MVTALWVGSTCRPPAIGSVATLYRISPDNRTKATASEISTGFARILVAGKRGRNARDFRPTFGHRTFAADEARRVFTLGQRSPRPALADPMAEPRSFSQIMA